MTTVGGAISGYCAIGNTCDAIRPAIVMMIEMTPANIGRLMKNSENDMVGSLLGGGGRCRWCRGGRFGDRRARTHLEQVVDDHAVARLEAREDRPVAADPVAHSHRARLRLAVRVDDEDEAGLFG